MTMRRMLILAGILLILFLGMYSWNRRTRVLDDLATNVGLELSAAVLTPLRSLEDVVSSFWNKYFDLVGVREENLRLKSRLEELEAKMLATGEELAELKRLRELVQFPVDVRWRPLAARVLAGRMGPNAVLDSVVISRGYMNGARPGIPIVTNLGLVGSILRSSAHASTALLITDPGSRIAVFGQESRAGGILKGHGLGNSLEVDFVKRGTNLKNGEVLVTSGLDDKFPKGLPVARVKNVAPSDYTQFMAVEAVPLVDLQHLEEVLLLEKSGVELPPEEPEGPAPVFTGPPLPPQLAKKRASVEPIQNPEEQNVSNMGSQPITPADTPRSPAKPRKTTVSSPPAPGGTQPNDIPRTADGSPRYRVVTP